MRYWALVCVFIVLGVVSSVQGLKCHEGFNVSISGVPFYHWKQRTCTYNSDCFGQEIMVRMPMGTVNFDVVMRYGSCISSAYKNYLDCNKLFGKDRTQDPAVLLDLIPDIAKRVNSTIQDFVTDRLVELKTLLSNGKGTNEFIDGIFTMMTNLGFKMEKVLPLKPSMAKMLEKLFSGSSIQIRTASDALLTALGNLETLKPEFADAMKKIIGPGPASSRYKPLAEKLPGLVRSTLNENWKPNLWYDVVFKLMGDINFRDWTKTAENMVKTIKSSYDIPKNVLDILNLIFDAIPDLVKNSQSNPTYIGTWSLELLKKYSKVDAATAALSKSLIKFIGGLTGRSLQQEYKTTIQYMPGLMYKFFPNKEADIQKVYNKMAVGFNSYDFTNPTNTATATKLSDFIISFVPKATNVTLTDLQKAIVINTASTIYGVLSDYTTYLDTFAEVMTEGFVKFPTFNAGTIVTKLITRMDGNVPDEIKPLLANLQGVLDAAIKTPFNANGLMSAFDAIINAYEVAYPTSPFPRLAKRFLTLIDSTFVNRGILSTMDYAYWSIDLLFAVVKATNTDSNDFDKLLASAFPSYKTHIKMMRLMKAEDAKELVKNIAAWMSKRVRENFVETTERFVIAVKPAIQKITASISSLLAEIRTIHAPDSCKYGTCAENLCNTHIYIEARPAVTKAPISNGGKASHSIILITAAMWMAYKAFFRQSF